MYFVANKKIHTETRMQIPAMLEECCIRACEEGRWRQNLPGNKPSFYTNIFKNKVREMC